MTNTKTTPQEVTVLGPFVGFITHSSVKLWLYVQTQGTDRDVFVTLELRERGPKNEEMRRISEAVEKIEQPEVVRTAVIKCPQAKLGIGVVTIDGLEANAMYSYHLWNDEAHTLSLDLNGLEPAALFFWTLPEDGYGRQLDFLLMSCHNPGTAASLDRYQGFAVWRQIPEIIKEKQNANVRFAILSGDQIYADEIEEAVLKEKDPEQRRRLYLDVYKKFWNNEHYRRVLCRIPAILMWDDHDITDGWGSREDSFKKDKPQEFKDEWLELFRTAKEMFGLMQASRNPDPLSAGSFDTCFKIGKAGFAVADLRSHRNSRADPKSGSRKPTYEGRIWLPEQMEAIRRWVEANRSEIDTLFFVSSVVFSHGVPAIERGVLKYWFHVLDVGNFMGKIWFLRKIAKRFNNAVGDLRDDINDSWGADINAIETGRVLDFLFGLQNPVDGGKAINVVILSGDIHTPGYSMIYSADPPHARKAVIPHVVATPVSYKQFPWAAEALFRHLTKVVPLGLRQTVISPGKTISTYTAQISHHFCYRNIAVASLRSYEADESYLKVKYYLEGFPEPQIMLFDLIHNSRREGIDWPEHLKVLKTRKV